MNIHSFVEHRSWGKRIKDAILGIPVGIVMVIIAVYALVWGEINHAKTTNLLKHIEPDIKISQQNNSSELDNDLVNIQKT